MDLAKTENNKKELLINILKVINPYRDLAEGFLTIIENINDESLINNILIEIQKGIKSIKSQRSKEIIKKEITKIYQKNDDKTNKDKKNADKFLENFINNL